MAWTDEIAREMRISQEIVSSVAKKIDVRGNYRGNYILGYEISDDNIQKLKKAVWKFCKDEVQEYISEFGVNSPQTKELAKEYKMEHLLSEEDSELEKQVEKLQFENSSLLSNLSKSEKTASELQAKLDLIEQEKKETAEIVERIKEKFLK